MYLLAVSVVIVVVAVGGFVFLFLMAVFNELNKARNLQITVIKRTSRD